jgi:hypothetical protein
MNEDSEADSQATCRRGPVAFCAATVSSSNPVSPAYAQKRKSVWTPSYSFMQSAITLYVHAEKAAFRHETTMGPNNSTSAKGSE